MFKSIFESFDWATFLGTLAGSAVISTILKAWLDNMGFARQSKHRIRLEEQHHSYKSLHDAAARAYDADIGLHTALEKVARSELPLPKHLIEVVDRAYNDFLVSNNKLAPLSFLAPNVDKRFDRKYEAFAVAHLECAKSLRSIYSDPAAKKDELPDALESLRNLETCFKELHAAYEYWLRH